MDQFPRGSTAQIIGRSSDLGIITNITFPHVYPQWFTILIPSLQRRDRTGLIPVSLFTRFISNHESDTYNFVRNIKLFVLHVFQYTIVIFSMQVPSSKIVLLLLASPLRLFRFPFRFHVHHLDISEFDI